MFEELMYAVHGAIAKFHYELALCNDPYRLTQITKAHVENMGHIYDEANQMVKELEESHDR